MSYEEKTHIILPVWQLNWSHFLQKQGGRRNLADLYLTFRVNISWCRSYEYVCIAGN